MIYKNLDYDIAEINLALKCNGNFPFTQPHQKMIQILW